jgi:hypothetical protein
MRIISIRGILIASFVIGFAITGVSAQQMPLGPGGGYPGFMGAPPPPGGGYPGPMCAPPPPPMKCRPPVQPPCAPAPNMGCAPSPCFDPYGCPPPMCAPPATAEPSAYVGYLFKDHGAGVNIEFNNGDVVSITSTRNDFDLQGVWLELALPFVLCQNATGFVTGAHLFPVQTKALQSYQELTGSARREWDPDVHWWELTTGLAYRFCPVASAVGGFRWSSFVVDFNNPTGQLGFATTTDDAKLTVNAYIPFFGLAASAESCTSSIRAAVLGFPALPSTVEWQETLSPTGQTSTRLFGNTDNKSGYFIEALGEASTKMNNWSLGAFVRFDVIHTDRTRDFNVDGVSRQADIKFDRRNWILGGKIGLVF